MNFKVHKLKFWSPLRYDMTKAALVEDIYYSDDDNDKNKNNLSVWGLHVLPVSAWVSGYSNFSSCYCYVIPVLQRKIDFIPM